MGSYGSQPEFGWNSGQLGESLIDNFSIRQVPSSAGPAPINGSFAQSAADGILMDVINRTAECLGRAEVPIVAWTFLPEAEGFDSGALANGQSLEERAGMSDQALLDSKRIGTFDGLQESIHFRGPLKGEDQQVNMFGHEYERSQSPVVSLHRGVDGSGEHLSPGILGQQRDSAVTRTGQFPSVRRVLKVLDRLAMPLDACHAAHSYGGNPKKATGEPQSAGCSCGPSHCWQASSGTRRRRMFRQGQDHGPPGSAAEREIRRPASRTGE